MIYIIQAGEIDGPVKIGWTTNNPFARMAELQTGNPHRLRLIAFLEGCHPDNERLFHRLLEADRMVGEWFRCSDLVRGLIKAVALEQAGALIDGYSPISDWVCERVGIKEGMTAQEKLFICRKYGMQPCASLLEQEIANASID